MSRGSYQNARVFTGLLSRIYELGGGGGSTEGERWSRTGSVLWCVCVRSYSILQSLSRILLFQLPSQLVITAVSSNQEVVYGGLQTSSHRSRCEFVTFIWLLIIPLIISLHRISVAFSYCHSPLVTVLPHDITAPHLIVSTLVLRSPITTTLTSLSVYLCP